MLIAEYIFCQLLAENDAAFIAELPLHADTASHRPAYALHCRQVSDYGSNIGRRFTPPADAR
jgi:hypothetical protein